MNFVMMKILLIVAAVSAAYAAVVPQKKTPAVHALFTSLALPKLLQPKPNDVPCDENQFMSCTQNLAKALGMSDMPDDATQFLYYILGYTLINGVSGFETICKATNDYEVCLGQSFDSCLSVQNLMSIGLDQDDATVYASFAPQIQYECGPAYEVFVDHFDCAMEDIKEKSYQIVNCINTFNSSVYQDPSKLCNELQTFTECYSNIFSDCGADFVAAMCGSMKAAYKISMPQCSISCPQGQIMKMKPNDTLRYKRGISFA